MAVGIIISCVVIVAIVMILKRRFVKKESFEDVPSVTSLVRREHGIEFGDDSKIMIKKRMNDGISDNSTVDKACTKAKVWYYKQVESKSDLYELDSKNFTVLTLTRKDDMQCISKNNKAAVTEDIKSRDVLKRDVQILTQESDFSLKQDPDPNDKFKDGLIREYCAYYIGEDDEATLNKDINIQFELDKEDTELVFFGRPLKASELRDQGFKQKIGGGASFCKIALKPEVNEKRQIPLQDSTFTRLFKRVEKNVYNVVYRNDMSKEVVNMSGIASLTDFRNKYCVMDCSKIIDKPNLWKKHNENTFKRTNFVDVVTNPTKRFCEETLDNDGKKIPTSSEYIKRSEDIDSERYKYDESTDTYKSKLEYNSQDVYYEGGDPKFEKPLTKCDIGYSYETAKPVKKVIDQLRWIYVEDRKCVDVNPCDKIFPTPLKFDFGREVQVGSYEYKKIEVNNKPKFEKFLTCKGIQIECNISTQKVKQAKKIRPVLMIKKKDKEVVLKAILDSSGQVSKLIGKSNDPLDPPIMVKCTEESILGDDKHKVYIQKPDELRPIPGDNIALSWNPKWKENVQTIDCNGKNVAEPVAKNEKLAYKQDKESTETEDGSLFTEFNLFPGDEFEFYVKSGSYAVKLTGLSIVFNAQYSEIIVEPATYTTNNTCGIQKYDECDYKTQYYSPSDKYSCKKYSERTPKCPTSISSEHDNLDCNVSKSYKKLSGDAKPDIIHNDDIQLNADFEKCQEVCETRPGCTSVDYMPEFRECIFRGHETRIIKFYGVDSNAKRKVTITHGNDRRRETEITGDGEVKLARPSQIESIEIVGGLVKKVVLYRHDNSVQKEYSETDLKKFVHTEQLMIIDGVYFNVNAVVKSNEFASASTSQSAPAANKSCIRTVTAKRLDFAGGWGMDLKFKCGDKTINIGRSADGVNERTSDGIDLTSADCPKEINKTNWLNPEKYPDRFGITVSDCKSADQESQVAPVSKDRMLKCVDSRNRGKNKWVSHGRKTFTEEEARAKCAGYKYMSLECPTDKTNFEVWCANDLSGMPVLPDDDCKGKPSVKSLNNGKNGGCNAGGGSFKTTEGLNKGGWHRGSVYEIKPGAVKVPDDASSQAKCYGARYWDLRAAFGSNEAALNNHYKRHGVKEGRNKSCTMSDAEARCYLDRYEDVKNFAGSDLNKAREHFYKTGMSENRDFVCPPGVKELKCYVQRYPDLQKAFGTNYDTPGTSSTLYKAGQHWNGYGKKEGRNFSCKDVPKSPAASAAKATASAANDSKVSWRKIPGGLKQVDIDGNTVCGVNSRDHIYCKDDLEGAGWRKLPGRLKHVSVSGGKLYGVNKGDSIYYSPNTKGNWRQISGGLKQVDIDGKTVCGVNSSDHIYCKDDLEGAGWRRLPGSLKYVSVSGGKLYGVNSGDSIYYSPGNKI